MELFISWSGPKSQAVAQALHVWIPQVINAINPWLSKEDIGKGRRWSPEIASQLEVSRAGIVCVTAANRDAPWLLFEAGALSKAVGEAFVCPLLIDVTSENITGPLAQFQATEPTKPDMRRLIGDLNKAAGEGSRSDAQLSTAFEKWWPDLDATFKALPAEGSRKNEVRKPDEMIPEILEIVRSLQRDTLYRTEVSTGNLSPAISPAATPKLTWNLGAIPIAKFEEVIKSIDPSLTRVEVENLSPTKLGIRLRKEESWARITLSTEMALDDAINKIRDTAKRLT
ncbi:MAG TPA: TIR domain-containing protein [Terriglobales bacterium]|nr:TIR domain-containing protein [Terriglobales bacterium]